MLLAAPLLVLCPVARYFGELVQHLVLQFVPARRPEDYAKGLQDHKLPRQIGHEDGCYEHTELRGVLARG